MKAGPLVLASMSDVRRKLLEDAGVPFEARPPRINEEEVASEMLQHDRSHAEIAQALADEKALAVSAQMPGRTVLGADQVLSFEGELMMKCESPEEARARLRDLRGHSHDLIGAMALAKDGEIVWRHLEVSTLTMRDFSDRYLDGYLERGLPDILLSVGAYYLEEEGVQLFSKIEGDYFAILGLPLLPLLDALRERGLASS